jgi:hypothetical protein
MTPDFLVLECQTLILFVKLKDIEAINDSVSEIFAVD